MRLQSRKGPRQPKIELDRHFNRLGYLRRGAAAAYLGVSLRTLADWQRQRRIPFFRPSGGVTLFRMGDLDRALDRFKVEAVGGGE